MVGNSNYQLGETIPLYDEVKKNIYGLYQELKKSSTLLLTCRSNYKATYGIFIENFLNFYQEVCHKNKLDKIGENKSKYLRSAYDHIIKKKRLSTKQISNVSLYCRDLVEELGISKIEMKEDKRPGAVRNVF